MGRALPGPLFSKPPAKIPAREESRDHRGRGVSGSPGMFGCHGASGCHGAMWDAGVPGDVWVPWDTRGISGCPGMFSKTRVDGARRN